MEQASLVSKGLEVGITAACVGALCGKHRQLGMARAWCRGDSCRRWHLSVMLKDSDFILKAMGTQRRALSRAVTWPALLERKKTLAAV